MAIVLTICIVIRRFRLSLIIKSVIVLLLLFIWNLCATSFVENIYFTVALLSACFIAYNKRNKKTAILEVAVVISCILAFPLVKKFFESSMISSPVVATEDDDSLSYQSDVYTLSEGIRMGDGYKADFCALQSCTVYDGKLYQFFNKGYYEIRDTSSMKLEREGRLNIPVDIHFGSVAFSNKIERGCSMPYLYATDDKGNEGCVYVIDFEKQKIVSNYNVSGGSIAAFDFSKKYGYLVSTAINNIDIEKFELKSGNVIDLFSIPLKEKLATLQSVVFYKGRVYLLSGETGKSLFLSDIDPYNKQIEIHSFPFKGEPEGLFFKENGDIVVTANIGEWGGVKTSKNYIHSEYFILRK